MLHPAVVGGLRSILLHVEEGGFAPTSGRALKVRADNRFGRISSQGAGCRQLIFALPRSHEILGCSRNHFADLMRVEVCDGIAWLCLCCSAFPSLLLL